MANEKGAEFYYNSSDSIGEFAAKSASDSSQYTAPKDVFTIHNYYADADANYEYITPRTSTSDYGGWASYDYHAIAKDKFYYYDRNTSSSNTYTSFKFVHRSSAPLLKKTWSRQGSWDLCQSPFDYYAMAANDKGYGAEIYWDNAKKSIRVYTLDEFGHRQYQAWRAGYGVFILLSGAGGGGGGGDSEYWGQGHPGGGGGGGGGTALIYFDAKKAYDNYKDCCLWITIGKGGAGGKGGSGFTAGSAGVDSVATLKTSSGTTMCKITCAGGLGGAGHAWDAAADSAGGNGGAVTTSFNGGQYATTLQYLKLVDSVSGGKGGAGKRGADGISGNSIAGGNWKIPFTASWGTWGKRDVFSDGSRTCSMGEGGAHNWQGGGGGGCAAGFKIKNSSTPAVLDGCGTGGYGGGKDQAGAAGLNGFCGIFWNIIPGYTDGCDVKKV